jgi:PPIC-type PPIASE domain
MRRWPVRRSRPGVGSCLRQACRWAALALAAAPLGGCRQLPPIAADVVVRIHGEELHYDQFETYLRDHIDADGAALDSEAQSRLFDQFLDQQLLVRLAVERGIVEPGVELRKALERIVGSQPRTEWTEPQLRAYYNAHQAEFRRPEEVRLRQILVADREVAEQAQAALAAGEDFAQVAARFSQEPNAQMGGEQGRLARQDLPVAYADIIFDLAAGEATGIVPADYGFHIFQVVERYPAELPPFQEVADTIRQALERQRVDEIVAGFIDEARERYNVIVFPSNIPFDYQGDYVHRNTASNIP